MRTIIIILFLLLSIDSTAQVDTMTTVSDHLIIEKKCKGEKCKYWVDNKRVSQADYEKHLNEPTVATCKPCYLKHVDSKGNLLFEGDFYEDCCIGTYITRYRSGKIKVKGQYTIPATKTPNYNNGECRPDGEWTYFKENGDIEKIEIYKDGKLVK